MAHNINTYQIPQEETKQNHETAWDEMEYHPLEGKETASPAIITKEAEKNIYDFKKRNIKLGHAALRGMIFGKTDKLAA